MHLKDEEFNRFKIESEHLLDRMRGDLREKDETIFELRNMIDSLRDRLHEVTL